MGNRVEYTEHLQSIIREYYPYTATKKLAEQLGICEKSLNDFAKRNGLKKSREYFDSIINVTGARDGSGRFIKGHAPANKGKVMSQELREKVAHTWFQKGNDPHNTKYDGHESIDTEGYVYIRVRKGKYVLKHRHIYEQAHGSIPDGYCLSFKDGNKLNVTLENLELITREQNMLRNTWHNYPELKPTMRALSRLKKAIDQHAT